MKKNYRIFKVANIEEVGNYRLISVIPITSKVLEIIMYNINYQYFTQNDMFFPKHFQFQVYNSTNHVILNLTDEILRSFEKGEFKKCLSWFKSYLKHRQQFVSFGKCATLWCTTGLHSWIGPPYVPLIYKWPFQEFK